MSVLPGVRRTNEGGSVAEAFGWGQQRPATRPPDNVPAAGARAKARDPRGAGMPRAPVDSLDRFGAGRAASGYQRPKTEWTAPAPNIGQISTAEITAQLSQVQARLGHLEQENATLKRTMEQRDADIRKAANAEQVLRAVTRQMQEIDETLRRASRAHDGTSRRVRALEDAVGLSGDSGSAHDTRIRLIEETVRGFQEQAQVLEGGLEKAAVERAQIKESALASVEECRKKLTADADTTGKALAARYREVQEGQRQAEENARSLITQLADDVNRRFDQVHTNLVPGVDRTLREQIAELRRVMESSITQIAEDLASTRDASERGDLALRKDLKDLQTVAQKGLLTLRSESEKQGKALAAIIKEEISTRTLNVETTNKHIEEIRLQLDADMSSNGSELANVQAQLQSQLEITQNDIVAVREELEGHRGTLEGGSIDMRAELLAAIEQRHNSCMDTIKSYGLATEQELRQVANRIVKEEMARAEADSNEMKVVDQLREQVAKSVEDWRTAMDRFDEQHLSTQELHKQDQQSLRQDLEAQVASSLNMVRTIEQTLREVVNTTSNELHMRVDQTVTTYDEKLRSQQHTFDTALEQLGTETNSRFDVTEESLNRQVGSVRDDVNGMSEELTNLQDETKQTLVGFREYMDTELEAVNNQQDEMRDTFKSAIEVSYEEAKRDAEFSVSSMEQTLREHVQEEISNANSSTEQGIESVKIQFRENLSDVAKEVEACGAMRSEIQGLRVRVTAGEEARATLHSRLESGLEAARTAAHTATKCVDESVAELAVLVQQSNATLEQTTATLNTYEQMASKQQEQLTGVIENHSSTKQSLEKAEQSLRINVTRMDERLGRVHARFSEVEVALDSMKSTVDARVDSIDSQVQGALDVYKAEREPVVDNLLADHAAKLESCSQSSEAQRNQVVKVAKTLADNATKNMDRMDGLEQRLSADIGELREMTVPAIAEIKGQLSETASESQSGLKGVSAQVERLRQECKRLTDVQSAPIQRKPAAAAAAAVAVAPAPAPSLAQETAQSVDRKPGQVPSPIAKHESAATTDSTELPTAAAPQPEQDNTPTSEHPVDVGAETQ